jgi:hypothetical protein
LSERHNGSAGAAYLWHVDVQLAIGKSSEVEGTSAGFLFARPAGAAPSGWVA